MLTEQEKKILEASANVWNEFMLLPEQHPDDIRDFRFHIHAIQNILLGMSATRMLKEEGISI